MNKKNIIIWGGNNKDLILSNLDSHSSVNAFFLTKNLKNYYNVININSQDCAENILNYKNIHAVISTSQYGFTNRLIKKGKTALYNEIRKHVSGYLCSIADYNYAEKYFEDILFCVRPVSNNNLKFSKKYNKNFTAVRTGWCSDPELFKPDNVGKSDFNIFIDHPPYSDNSLNYVKKYFKALKDINNHFPSVNFNIYHQNNSGIIKFNQIEKSSLDKVYDRTIKVPYDKIIDVIKNIHVFCYTHKESAGLSGIEAASSGAKLYIPSDFLGRTFVKKDLLNKTIDYKIIYPLSFIFKKEFYNDIKQGINKNTNRQMFINSENTWFNAAKTIYETIG